MSRIQGLFKQKKPFIGYLTAGDGGLKQTEEMAFALIEGGVDLLELGIPFSDPIADGPVIQRASERALKEKTTPFQILDLVFSLRKKVETPIVLMTYYNPIFILGFSFLKKAKEVGVDGLIVVDLPPEEAKPYLDQMKTLNLDTIFIIAPSTPPHRILSICKVTTGFIYYACRKGTTGIKKDLPEDLADKVSSIRQKSSLPIAVGFGVSSQDGAREILKIADGFIVGSLITQAISEGKKKMEIKALIASLNASKG